MERLWGYDNKFFELLGKVSDIIILNFLCIIFSIPIVTIGSSITSLYYVCLKIVDDEDPYIVKTFIKSFKENLKTSTIIWAVFLIIGGVLLIDFYISNQLINNIFANILKFIFTIVGVIYIFSLSYVFPIISKFENTIKNTIMNSILISIHNLPYTIIITTINLMWLIIVMVSPSSWGYVLFFYITMGIGITAFINSLYFNKIFSKYICE